MRDEVRRVAPDAVAGHPAATRGTMPGSDGAGNDGVGHDGAGTDGASGDGVGGDGAGHGRIPELTNVRIPRVAGDEATIRLVVDQLADGVVVVDEHGVIRFANRAAVAMFRRSEAELVGADFGVPITDDDERTEIEIIRAGGEPFTAELRVARTDWAGEPARLVSLRDVSDRKAAEARERELARERAARAEAEAANRAKSDFLATMSHELRTPLNAVLGYAELLDIGVGGPLTDAQREQINRITASGRHLLSLVDEVLDLARVEAGRLEIYRSVADARAAVDAALVLVAPQAEAAGVTLAPAQMDGDARDLQYVGDEDRVRQIVVNLLTNAVKFTRAGGTITVSVSHSEAAPYGSRVHGSGPWVSISVHDTGIGIAPAQQDQIFQPFVQVDAGHTRRRDGSGLGLTISRRLARLMEGDLTVKSSLGDGATFTLCLPAAARNAVNAPPISLAALAMSPDASVDGMGEIGDALITDLDSIVDNILRAIRNPERGIPAASGMRDSQVIDHLPTLLADIANTLVVLEESSGAPSPILRDGAEIQRVLGERHGVQRAQLGWTLEGVQQEYRIILDEMRRAVSARFGPREENERSAHRGRVAAVHVIIGRLLEQVERASVNGFTRSRALVHATDPGTLHA